MKNKILSILIIVMCTVTGSCKLGSSDNENDKSKQHRSKPGSNRVTDILEYKIKEEHHQNDSLDLTFEKIILEKIAPSEYQLKVDVSTAPSKVQFHGNYYIILAIYPEDDDIDLLAPERKKHGFESFSAKIEKDKESNLFVMRKIQTEIEFARAITLTVMEYRNNRKTMVIVMQNVAL
ncbi:MAG TPA: hypothetical protein VFM69_12410 [Pricia sp.]|nr:hypothetical protein [Pricia sp.]